ncbi:MAG TPA: OmpA family protein [Polyangiales bacterium]|nr:OmpA family protein [Polyangiales bacterium]
MKTILTTVALAAAACLACACGHETKPAAVAPTTITSANTTKLSASSPGKVNSTIYLSDRFRQACQIQTIESVKEAPKFAFDQSDIQSEDRDVLAQVAQCLTTGPLKGQPVRLIGRADPRGTEEYNMALGARRSSSVMSYLESSGVPASQMTDTSRGELDATGTGDAAWQKDRRVDIDLVDSMP